MTNSTDAQLVDDLVDALDDDPDGSLPTGKVMDGYRCFPQVAAIPGLAKWPAVVFFVIVCLLPRDVGAQTDGLRYTVAVDRFENAAGRPEIDDAWVTVLSESLEQNGFMVVTEHDMPGSLGASGREQELGATARRPLTSSQVLLKGEITRVHDRMGRGGRGIGGPRIGIRAPRGGSASDSQIEITIRLIDSSTGQVLVSKNVVGTAKGGTTGAWGAASRGKRGDDLDKAIIDASTQVVQWTTDQLRRVPWRATVVMVKNGQVYINRGRRDGVTVGQELVVGETDVIRDPDTGEVLDTSIREIARLRAARIEEKLTVCEVVSGSAASISKGQDAITPLECVIGTSPCVKGGKQTCCSDD